MSDNTTLKMNENVEAALAYSLPFLAPISGIILLILEKENKFVRFHAMQSFIVMGVLNIIFLVARSIPLIRFMLGPVALLVLIAAWAIMIFKAYQGRTFKFPLFGEVIYNQVMAK